MEMLEVCFYPTDNVEERFVDPTVRELERLGISAAVDVNMSKHSKVGIFLGHHSKNKPDLATTSIIMLHDLGQAHNVWPNFWRREPWGKYDYGILPNKLWGNMYRDQYVAELLTTIKGELQNVSDLTSLGSKTEFSFQFTSPFFPKNGVQVVGWPKYKLDTFLQKKQNFIREFGTFAERETLNILYAPSWEFNNQQDGLINSIVDLPVHIFVKHQHWLGDGGAHMERVNEMAKIHKGRWPNVTILDPKTDIFDALVRADCVISEESSTLTEGTMVGVLPFAVSDWLVPDTSPPRQASVPYPYVTKILSCEIRKTFENLIQPGALETAQEKIELDLVDSEFADDPVAAVANFILEKVHLQDQDVKIKMIAGANASKK